MAFAGSGELASCFIFLAGAFGRHAPRSGEVNADYAPFVYGDRASWPALDGHAAAFDGAFYRDDYFFISFRFARPPSYWRRRRVTHHRRQRRFRRQIARLRSAASWLAARHGQRRCFMSIFDGPRAATSRAGPWAVDIMRASDTARDGATARRRALIAAPRRAPAPLAIASTARPLIGPGVSPFRRCRLGRPR